eukprot:359972-Chlamydomonas_euryale.AAC.3
MKERSRDGRRRTPGGEMGAVCPDHAAPSSRHWLAGCLMHLNPAFPPRAVCAAQVPCRALRDVHQVPGQGHRKRQRGRAVFAQGAVPQGHDAQGGRGGCAVHPQAGHGGEGHSDQCRHCARRAHLPLVLCGRGRGGHGASVASMAPPLGSEL